MSYRAEINSYLDDVSETKLSRGPKLLSIMYGKLLELKLPKSTHIIHYGSSIVFRKSDLSIPHIKCMEFQGKIHITHDFGKFPNIKSDKFITSVEHGLDIVSKLLESSFS